MRIFRHLGMMLALAVVAGTAHGQSATIAATATVVTPIAVTGAAPLAFGSVFQGINKTILFSDATSGRFSLTGYLNSQVSMTFTLPATLSSGASTMPINTYDIRVNGTNSTTGTTTLVVTSGTPVLSNFVAGALFVFVGGRVQPGAAQTPGTYTGTIVLAAAYTGL